LAGIESQNPSSPFFMDANKAALMAATKPDIKNNNMDKTANSSVYDSASQVTPELEELREIIRYRNLVVQMVRRDILTRYKRSVLGVAWTMLNPLGISIVLAVVFSSVFGGADKGYPVYVLSGLIAWNFFSQTTNAAIVNLVWGGGLLNRIYIPRTVFAVSAIGTGLVNLLLSLVPLIIVMLFFNIPLTPSLLILPIPILFLAMFSLGLGLFISSLAIYYSDVAEMYQIVLMAWFYLSPVIFTDDFLPPQVLAVIKIVNPMYHLINLFRAPIYEGRIPDLTEFLVSGLWAVTALLIGWIVFSRRADEFAYRV
jgi:ABC-type polysaccharide/polyol phosphate export permease